MSFYFYLSFIVLFWGFCGILFYFCILWKKWSTMDWKNFNLILHTRNTLCVHACMISHFSHVWLFATPWTGARQAPLSMGFSRQAYWSGLPRPPPGDLPDPGTEPTSLMSPVFAGEFHTTNATWEAQYHILASFNSWLKRIHLIIIMYHLI